MEQKRPNYKVNDVIRNKQSGHPYLILHVSRFYLTVIDLEDNNKMVLPLVILSRNFDEYAIEHNMELKKNKWEYKPVIL